MMGGRSAMQGGYFFLRFWRTPMIAMISNPN
jgi:hypothetical protein